MDKFIVTAKALSVDAAWRAVKRPDCGGYALFAGAVRNHHDGKKVTKIAYSAHAKMALAEFKRYAAEARKKWKELGSFYLAHRTGRLRIGDISVLIAVSAVHRGEAFAVCRHLIERLKADAPIWKEEHYSDGKAWIGNACEHE